MKHTSLIRRGSAALLALLLAFSMLPTALAADACPKCTSTNCVKTVVKAANCHETGVDTNGILVLEYDGFLCNLMGAKDCAARNGVQVIGEDGYLEVSPSGSSLQTVSVNLRGKESETVHHPENPWYHEVQDLGRLVEAGDYEYCYKELEVTRNVVEVLEKARKFAGFSFCGASNTTLVTSK